MGALTFVTPRIESLLRSMGGNVKYDCVSRAESASPATGSHKAHVIEQQRILNAAFGR
jgi:2-oxoglutarate dehydrogenase E1 component